MTDDKRCGNCKHWVRTRAHGGQGGSRLACKPEQAECPHCWPVIDILRTETNIYWCDLIADNVKGDAECACVCKRLMMQKADGDKGGAK